MSKSDRYVIAKMFLFIIRGIATVIATIHNSSSESKAYADKWMEDTEKFAGEVDKWAEG